jgi:membrane fusion protein, multidrug efflux system
MRHKVIISAISAIAVAAIVAGVGVTHRHIKAASAPAPVVPTVPVVAGTVTSGDVPIYLQGVGTVIAYNTVIVRSQIQGQITKINFTEGQAVKTGDLLAVIDPRPYQAQLDQANANRTRDEAQLTNAQANLKRYTTLGNQG